MPYRRRDCGKYFSVKTGTVMAGSPLPIRKWVYAIYLDATSLQGVSSMKLHRDIGVTQETAWFIQQRIREAFAEVGPLVFNGPVEVDEAFVGGKRKNMSNKRRKELEGQRGPAVGKTVVVGAKDRELVAYLLLAVGFFGRRPPLLPPAIPLAVVRLLLARGEHHGRHDPSGIVGRPASRRPARPLFGRSLTAPCWLTC
ncbi:MAG: IS1595 family transposase [Gemmatimonadota bacterium]|nr:IS1595 family transposase [Gemmatimonadota bacterium]